MVLSYWGSDSKSSSLELSIKQSELEQATHEVALWQEEVRKYERSLQQNTDLWTVGGISQNEFLHSQQDLRKSTESLGIAQAKLEQIQLSLSQLQNRLEASITSPVTGRIFNLGVNHHGEVVSYGKSLLEVLPSNVPIIFKAYLPESQRSKIYEGSAVEIAWSNFPKQKYSTSSGQLIAIAPTVTLNNAQAVYELEIELYNLSVDQ